MQDSLAVSHAIGPAANQRCDARNGRDPAELLDAIVELTQRHFPKGPVDVETDCDPEVPSDEFFVLSVTVSGSAREIADQQRLWRRTIRSLVGDRFDAFRISVRDIV